MVIAPPRSAERAPSRQSRSSATDDATWVRTGDLGAYHDGELYITGRTKDLVIIDGRNHYPQDLEYSAQESTKALRTGFVAAFSVPANQLPDEVFEDAHAGLKRDPDDTSEQLVIVGERAPGAHKLEMGPIADDIRAAIPAGRFDDLREHVLGRYYAQSEPGADPFVELGDEVDKDTTVALIEVMKMFTAVPAGVDGVISEIFAQNEEIVEFGQNLFRVRIK